MKKITIITVNYNNAGQLEHTIKSVVCQKYPDIEYIVIDGGSKDNSIDVIKKYNDSISFWVSEPDSGIYDAMNKGIFHSHGDYLLFLNSGDYFADDNVLVRIFGEKFCYTEDLLIGRQLFYDAKYRKKGISPLLHESEINMEFFLSSTLPHQATFIKRNLFEVYGLYDEEYRVCADWVFWVKVVIDKKCSLRILPYSVTFMEKGGVSADMEKCHHDMSKFLMKRLENGTLNWNVIFYTALKGRSQDFCTRTPFLKLLNKLMIKIGKMI